MILQTPCHCQDYSVTLTGTAQTALAARTDRSFLMLQAPSGQALTYSFTNPSPAAGSAGCFTLAAGSAPFLFGPNVPDGSLYVNGTSGVAVIMEA